MAAKRGRGAKAPEARRARSGAVPIRFGTSGWRGILGEEVTFPRLRAVATAALRELKKGSSSRRILVGYDGRFASERMAGIAAGIARREGLSPVLSEGPIPTPALTHAAAHRRIAGGLMFTASHNAAEYHGLKIFSPDGTAMQDAVARRIEKAALRCGGRPVDPEVVDRIPRLDLVADYRSRVLELLDRAAIRRARLRVVYDAMHGAGTGVLDPILERCGAEVEGLRDGIDPLFGGGVPDPRPSELAQLRRRTKRSGAAIGLATDGDGDRIAAVDSSGNALSETQTLALLVDHMARTGRLRRGVAVSIATGTLVDRVAAYHGLGVLRRPIGFKHLAVALCDRSADVCGEESGGFAWGAFSRDKDGILAGCLLAEAIALGSGSLRQQITALERRFGRSACGRRELPLRPEHRKALDRIARQPPAAVDGARVEALVREDGVQLRLGDGFVMWRRSGTEPVVRIYAEASGSRRLAQRLQAAERLLVRAGRA